jgi:hypothetical protein
VRAWRVQAMAKDSRPNRLRTNAAPHNRLNSLESLALQAN